MVLPKGSLERATLELFESADLAGVRSLLAGQPGVSAVLDGAGKAAAGIDHERAGDRTGDRPEDRAGHAR